MLNLLHLVVVEVCHIVQVAASVTREHPAGRYIEAATLQGCIRNSCVGVIHSTMIRVASFGALVPAQTLDARQTPGVQAPNTTRKCRCSDLGCKAATYL
jgi:hypothetical protein